MALITKSYVLADPYFGVKHTDDDGNEFTDDAWTAVLDAAQDLVVRDLNILVGGADYLSRSERHTWPSGKSLIFLLDSVPTREITEARVQIGTMPLLVIPSEWIDVMEPAMGHIQIVPISNVSPSAMGGYWVYLTQYSSFHGQIQGQWKFTYTAGYKASDAPATLKRVIALVAAVSLLPVSGDLILGAGVASSSTSIDGLSQSVSTTASAMYGGYSSRLEAFKKEIDGLMTVLRATHTPMGIA